MAGQASLYVCIVSLFLGSLLPTLPAYLPHRCFGGGRCELHFASLRVSFMYLGSASASASSRRASKA